MPVTKKLICVMSPTKVIQSTPKVESESDILNQNSVTNRLQAKE